MKLSLSKNREELEIAKKEYAQEVRNGGGIKESPTRLRNEIFSDLRRIHQTIEQLKTSLRVEGESYTRDPLDGEHPNAASKRYNRIWDEEEAAQRRANALCYVVSAIYGINSAELSLASTACRYRFALNPFITPSWLTYRAFGRILARVALASPSAMRIINIMIAIPIVKAANKNFISAIPWMIYLSIPGWLVIYALFYVLTSTYELL
jgi:hypothetical protein